MYAAQYIMKKISTSSLPNIRNAISMLLENGADPNTVNADGDSPLSILHKIECSQMHGMLGSEEAFEAMKAETESLLRLHGARAIKSSTCPDILSQVVAQLTVTLINVVTTNMIVESRDHQIAISSSIQLFRHWRLHPTVTSVSLQHGRTIEQDLLIFLQSPLVQNEHAIRNSETSRIEHTGRILGSSETPQPGDPQYLQSHNLGLVETKRSESPMQYAGLAPSERSKDCSYYLHRMAELQQRLFNVNRCLHYLDDHPHDSSETIDDLIAKATGQESGEVQEDAESLD